MINPSEIKLVDPPTACPRCGKSQFVDTFDQFAHGSVCERNFLATKAARLETANAELMELLQRAKSALWHHESGSCRTCSEDDCDECEKCSLTDVVIEIDERQGVH